MNKWWLFCISFFMLSTCVNKKNAEPGVKSLVLSQDSVISISYFEKLAWLEQKKQEMLNIPDNECYFWFSDDEELKELDPHAYWLMNRMMQMMNNIATADDGWAWMLAMNESVEMYNACLGRKIGSPELAMAAIEGLIDKYGAGNQPQMNTATYVDMTITHYKTLYSYLDMFVFMNDYDDQDDSDIMLMELHYQEYTRWFDLQNAINGLMNFYTYGGARYSSAPMDINLIFQNWFEERFKELKLELDIYSGGEYKPYRSDEASISVAKFDKLISFFKSRSLETVYNEYKTSLEGLEDDYIKERFEGCYDFDKIAEMIHLYETALAEWRKVRKQITVLLPIDRQDSYMEITKKMHTRFYNDLLDLKDIRY